MNIGTRSLLFGVHQFAIHPWFVAWAWWRLYGFPLDPRLWIAFVIHDWGYWGKPNMDGPEGEIHPVFAARIMGWLFDRPTQFGRADCVPSRDGHWPIGSWHDFCLYHSRFLAKHDGMPFSRLCVADKLSIALTPSWLYLPMARLSGELKEYMEGKGARTPAGTRSPRKWLRDVQQYCRAWAMEHRDGKQDEWTGTKHDLAEGDRPVEVRREKPGKEGAGATPARGP